MAFQESFHFVLEPVEQAKELVYQLYGLTEEEIEIEEGS